MTRDEFESTLTIARKFGGFGLDPYFRAWLDHDAEQRAEIVRLTEWHRIVLGTGTDREAVIRMAAAEYTQTAVQCWKDKCDQQEQEIARLREALEGMLFIFGHNDGYAQVKTAKQAFKKK